MNIIAAAGLIAAGVIHLIPVTGVLGSQRLSALYGIEIEEPVMVLLLQHRAVLFGLLGALLVASAFVPALRPAALVGGLVSIVAFLLLAGISGSQGPAITRVVRADWIALAALFPAIILMIQQRISP